MMRPLGALGHLRIFFFSLEKYSHLGPQKKPQGPVVGRGLQAQVWILMWEGDRGRPSGYYVAQLDGCPCASSDWASIRTAEGHGSPAHHLLFCSDPRKLVRLVMVPYSELLGQVMDLTERPHF